MMTRSATYQSAWPDRKWIARELKIYGFTIVVCGFAAVLAGGLSVVDALLPPLGGLANLGTIFEDLTAEDVLLAGPALLIPLIGAGLLRWVDRRAATRRATKMMAMEQELEALAREMRALRNASEAQLRETHDVASAVERLEKTLSQRSGSAG